MHGVHPEEVQPQARAGDVHDGVHRPHVVESHRLRRLAVGAASASASRVKTRIALAFTARAARHA